MEGVKSLKAFCDQLILIQVHCYCIHTFPLELLLQVWFRMDQVASNLGNGISEFLKVKPYQENTRMHFKEYPSKLSNCLCSLCLLGGLEHPALSRCCE